MFKGKKGEEGLNSMPLEIQIEAVLIIMLLLFAASLVSIVLQNTEYYHQYFKKDVSLVQDTLMMMPYDLSYTYEDHTNGKMSKLGFEIDPYYTSTLSEVNKLVTKNTITRDYIKIFNEKSRIKEKAVIFQPGELLKFSKKKGVFVVGSADLENSNSALCSNSDIDYSTYNIYIDSTQQDFQYIGGGQNIIKKYQSGVSIPEESLYIKIDKVDINKMVVYMGENNNLACKLRSKFYAEVAFIGKEYLENNDLDDFKEVLIVKVPRQHFNDFVKELKRLV